MHGEKDAYTDIINNYNLCTFRRRQKGRFFRGPLQLERKFMPFDTFEPLAVEQQKNI